MSVCETTRNEAQCCVHCLNHGEQMLMLLNQRKKGSLSSGVEGRDFMKF